MEKEKRYLNWMLIMAWSVFLILLAFFQIGIFTGHGFIYAPTDDLFALFAKGDITKHALRFLLAVRVVIPIFALMVIMFSFLFKLLPWVTFLIGFIVIFPFIGFDMSWETPGGLIALFTNTHMDIKSILIALWVFSQIVFAGVGTWFILRFIVFGYLKDRDENKSEKNSPRASEEEKKSFLSKFFRPFDPKILYARYKTMKKDPDPETEKKDKLLWKQTIPMANYFLKVFIGSFLILAILGVIFIRLIG